MTSPEFRKQAKKALRLRKKKMTYAAIALKMGVTEPTVQRYLRSLGAISAARQRKFTVEDLQAAIKAGHTTKAAAVAHLGCSPRTAQVLAVEAGITFRSGRAAALRQRITDAARAHFIGLPLEDVAQDVGVKVDTARTYLVRAGLMQTEKERVEARRRLARTLWRETDLTRSEIAEGLEIDGATVTRYLAGEPPREEL